MNILQFFKRKNYRNGTSLLFLVLVSVGYLLPNFYVYTTKIPEPSLRKSTSGIAHFEHDKNWGYRLNVNGIAMSCARTAVDSVDCLDSAEKRAAIEDRPVTVEWFAQEVFPFTFKNRVIDITFDGTTVLSEEETRRRIKQTAEAVLPMTLFVCLLFFSVAFLYRRAARRSSLGDQEKNNVKNMK